MCLSAETVQAGLVAKGAAIRNLALNWSTENGLPIANVPLGAAKRDGISSRKACCELHRNLRSDAGLVLETNSESENGKQWRRNATRRYLSDGALDDVYWRLHLGWHNSVWRYEDGKVAPSERAQLDRNTEMAQRRDDPEKRAAR